MSTAFPNLLRLLRGVLFKTPLYVHYGITHRCNLRCRMCGIYQDARGDEELSLAQIDTLFTAVRRSGVVYVSVGGGEPLLREDLPEVVALLTRKGFMVRVLTNGALADEHVVRRLVASGLREVSLSLDSLDPRKQASICRDDGIAEKIERAIDLFSALLPGRSKALLINTVVSALNIQELPPLTRFADKKGCAISFVPLESCASTEFAFTRDAFPWIDRSYDYLIGEKKKGRSPIFNSSRFLESSRRFLKTGRRDWPCAAGTLYFSVNPAGALSMCHRPGSGMPPVRTDLRALVSSRNFKAVRKRFIKDCPGCMRPCWAEVSLYVNDARSFWEMSMGALASRRAVMSPAGEGTA